MNERDLFLAYITAYNTKNVDLMLTFFHDDCLFENIFAGQVTASTKGKAELEALAKKSADAFALRQQKVRSLTQGQGRIIAEIDYHAVLRADLAPDLKAGSELNLRGVSVIEFSNGKIVRLSDYA